MYYHLADAMTFESIEKRIIADLKGRITYANAVFLRTSGYDIDELLGKAHNIVRHPDMPPEAYSDLWADLQAGRPWSGLVKNRCKNGDFYWVRANVTPIRQNGQVCGYMSVRTKPTREEVAAAEQVYRLLRETQQKRLVIEHGKAVHRGMASALRGLLRRGEVERPLTLGSQRKLRRLCRGPMPGGVGAAELEGGVEHRAPAHRRGDGLRLARGTSLPGDGAPARRDAAGAVITTQRRP